ncbi:hypothetical protein Agub_g13662 [Astrephomene gubernaculifera]|uniref:Thioredoxin domain-containing protein n=1 Tax=Astrephomene gubernaculifera TaxID=47775 RepID=A0AAD3E086_9CHLO|nr:hypothetical protein Agub_g13662 [Astrephomene gubernaculifera]
MMAPIFEKLSAEFTTVKSLKADVDEFQKVAAECGVRVMPTFIGFYNGEQVETVVGADQAQLRALLTTLASKGGAGAGQKLGGGAASTALQTTARKLGGPACWRH